MQRTPIPRSIQPRPNTHLVELAQTLQNRQLIGYLELNEADRAFALRAVLSDAVLLRGEVRDIGHGAGGLARMSEMG
jgi:hypothetical protein